MKRILIVPPSAPHDCSPELPLSKSIANRQLCIRHLSGSKLPVSIPGSQDCLTMDSLLRLLSLDPQAPVYDCGDAGTVFRFLTAVLAITEGRRTLTGSARMQQRPCGPLVEALQHLGAEINYSGKPGFPPLEITGKPLRGGTVEIEASVSSQFISALMMIAPLMPLGLQIKLTGNPVSAPYIAMTAGLMREQGIEVTEAPDLIVVNPGNYQFHPETAESDWSAASYWFACSALKKDAVITLRGLKESSLQGDSRLVQIFSHLGVNAFRERETLVLNQNGKADAQIGVDFTPFPDLFPAVAVTCAGLGLKARFTGLKTLTIKESNRIESVGTELRKLGFSAGMKADGSFAIEPGRQVTSGVVVHPWNDHRIAMAFAMLSVVCGQMTLDDPGVVSKSYPGFWDELERAGFLLTADREDSF